MYGTIPAVQVLIDKNKIKHLLYLAGNVCILLPLLGVLVVVTPLLYAYLFPTPLRPLSQLHTFTITIPKINAQAMIMEQVDPWNEVVYDKALKHGVAQAKGSVYPNQKGTIYLFAHSSQAPWEITTNNIPFLRIGELNKDDRIYINWKNKVYVYAVTSIKEIWPNETKYLTNLKPTQLILQTCTPIGTSLKRLLVFAQIDTKKTL